MIIAENNLEYKDFGLGIELQGQVCYTRRAGDAPAGNRKS
jgi:hypothetical protein